MRCVLWLYEWFQCLHLVCLVSVSTGCLDDGRDEEADGSTGGFQRKSDDKLYAKDDLAVGVTSYLNQPLCRDALGVGMGLRHDGTRGRRVSVCRDIEFHFSVQPAVDSPTNCLIARCERPRDLPLSLALESATNSLMTSHSSVAVDWEVVRRRNSYVHVSGQDWIFFICLLVFLSLSLDIAVHNFLLVLLALQAMYFLLLSVV